MELVKDVSYICIHNCTITKLLGGNFLVQHDKSRQTIFVCTEVDAYKVARLLNLDYMISEWSSY